MSRVVASITGIFLLLSLRLFSQNFYQIDWSDGDVSYSALLVWYSDNDAYARVGYTDAKGEYKVAEFTCKGQYFTADDGSQHYFIDGDAARMIYGDDKIGYSADNFIFSNPNSKNEFQDCFTIDDSQMEGDVNEDDLSEAKVQQMDASEFTEDYLNSYFFTDEPQFKLFMPGTKSVADNAPPPGKNTKLHLIVVANSLDLTIGSGCEVDCKKLNIEFDDISEALGIGYESHIITGKEFTQDNVLKTVRALTPGPNDIVVFFYRGHGFRWSDQESAWPQMSMRYSNFQPLVGLPLIDIYNEIKGKGARLNLVFGDMCNNDIGLSQPMTNASSAMQSNFYPSMEKLNHLFLDARGSIISAAAKPGEVSWVNNYDGGLYTTSFLEALHKEVSKYSGTGDWNNLIDYTIQKAEYKSTAGCSNCTAQHGIKNVAVKYE